MNTITENEMNFILTVLRNPNVEYNARSLAKVMGISHMGVLKIAVRLQKEGIIRSRLVGKAKIYNLNLENKYVNKYIEFLLQREAEKASAYVKVWIKEIRKIKNAQALILFGSVLNKEREANDIDTLIIADEKNLDSIKKDIKQIDQVNNKKIHPIFQTKEDLKKNINNNDKVILNAIKGIVVIGEDILLGAIK